MKNYTRLLALLLALVMLLASCAANDGKSDKTGKDDGKETAAPTESLSEGETESESESEPQSEGTPSGTGKETESETPRETEPETDAPLSEYRASISKTREEIESLITIKTEDFDEAKAKLDAFESVAIASTNYEEVDAVYMEFEDFFYYISTQISLANIIYDLNRSNTEASARYLDNYDLFGDLYNDYMAACRNVYLESPIRDELFADWSEDEISQLLNYTPESQELRQKNEELLVELNEISGDKSKNERIAEIYAEIVTNNNRIARLAGYENYYVYASSEIYGRDYTTEDIAQFKNYVIEYFMPRFDKLANGWYENYAKFNKADSNFLVDFLYDPFDSLDKNYLEGYINSYAEGNSTGAGFKHLFENRNMIFASAKNSHQSAYQTYLEALDTSFCLFGSDGQSTTTIVHEMGHYYAALYNPHLSSYDLAEIQSQANEFLFLRYVSTEIPRHIYTVIKDYTLYNTVAMILVCIIIDEFEQKVYSLESVEGFTMVDFEKIMTEACQPYGGIKYINDNITDMNEYWKIVCPNSPVYYISYATSSISALNIYAIANKDAEAGREVYRKLIEEIGENAKFKSALASVGLSDPFSSETFIAVAEILPKS